jgi:hypothetical protein
MRVRWVTKDGNWKHLTTSIASGGGVSSHVVISRNDGQFVSRDEKDWELLGGPLSSDVAFRSVKFLRERQGLTGTSEILGFKTFIFRGASSSSTRYFETHYSPEIGRIPLKIVFRQDEWGETVIEAIRVDFTDVQENVVADPDSTNVKLELLVERIARAESGNRLEEAESLKRVLTDWQQLNDRGGKRQ